MGREVIRGLPAKAVMVVPTGKWQVHYAFFSRKGFTEAAKEEARQLGARLVILEDLENDFRAWMHRRR